MRVVSMPLLFKACSDILDVHCVPMHYVALTERAVTTHGRLRSSYSKSEWADQIEDVREKMLAAGQFGCGYLGTPLCLGFKRAWFPGAEEPTLFNRDASDANAVRIPAVPALFIDAGTEALLRAPHMLTKFASSPRRWRGCMLGLSVEEHVRDWARRSWPRFYEPADNAGQYAVPCNHDFKLSINGATYLIDVFSSGVDREWKPPAPGKRTADLHLACDFDRATSAVLWRGVTRGADYAHSYFPEAAVSPLVMRAWLNSVHAGLPYSEILESIRLRGAA